MEPLPADLVRDLYVCLQCGYCVPVCPVTKDEDRVWESFSPRGKVLYLKELHRQGLRRGLGGYRFGPNRDFLESVYTCSSCGACQTACHLDIKFNDHWNVVKEWLIANGVPPLEGHRKLYEHYRTTNNIYGEPDDRRLAWLPKDVALSPNPDIIYYVGCTAAYREPQVAIDTVRLIEAAGIPFNIMPEERCCGGPVLRTGQGRDIKREIATKAFMEVEGTGTRVMLVSSADCWETWRTQYQQHVGKMTFEPIHISVWLDRMIAEKRLRPTKELKRKVTYHDPCFIGRQGGIYEEPRRVLKAIKGIELVEMPHNRADATCCGAGGGYEFAFRERSEGVAARRMREAEETGAELVVTSCPQCMHQLNRGAQHAGMKLRAADLTSLLVQAL